MQRLSGRDNTGLLGRMLRPTSSLVHMTPDDVAFDLLAGDPGLDPLNDLLDLAPGITPHVPQ